MHAHKLQLQGKPATIPSFSDATIQRVKSAATVPPRQFSKPAELPSQYPPLQDNVLPLSFMSLEHRRWEIHLTINIDLTTWAFLFKLKVSRQLHICRRKASICSTNKTFLNTRYDCTKQVNSRRPTTHMRRCSRCAESNHTIPCHVGRDYEREAPCCFQMLL